MDESFKPPYDESKEIEIIYDFHNCQVWRINTTNSDIFLKSGYEYDKGIQQRLDSLGRCRLIYVVDKIPPLTAILRHIESPFEINWAAMAIIIKQETSFFEKVNPIISYGLGITQFKNKFTVGVFDYSYRNNLKRVIEWLDENMEMKDPDKPIKWFKDKNL